MSIYFQKKQMFNRPRDRDGQEMLAIRPGLYSEQDLLRLCSEWKIWQTAGNLPIVRVSPTADVAVNYPNPQGKLRVMRNQFLSSCPIDKEQLRRFQREDKITTELREFLRSLGDGYLYVWIPENQHTPNRTNPVQLHRLVAESFVPLNELCYDYDDKGKLFLRRDLQVDHLDNDRLNNNHTNLIWVPPEVNRAWIGMAAEEKLVLLESANDIPTFH